MPDFPPASSGAFTHAEDLETKGYVWEPNEIDRETVRITCRIIMHEKSGTLCFQCPEN